VLLHAIIHTADIQDRDGGILLLATLFGRCLLCSGISLPCGADMGEREAATPHCTNRSAYHPEAHARIKPGRPPQMVELAYPHLHPGLLILLHLIRGKAYKALGAANHMRLTDASIRTGNHLCRNRFDLLFHEGDEPCPRRSLFLLRASHWDRSCPRAPRPFLSRRSSQYWHPT
jgi:hypothetical protein